MDRKTVGMITSYPGVTQSDWLWHQTPHYFGVWGNIQMLIHHPKPDFLLMYQYDFPGAPQEQPWLERLLSKKSPKQLDIQPNLRGVSKEQIVYLVREPPFDKTLENRKTGYAMAQQYCGYISGPDDFAPVPEYMPAIWYLGNLFEELDQAPPPEKARSCSWITSGISRTENHRKRLDFLKLLQDNDVQFDLYGRNLPQWAKAPGELRGKWHGMAPYYYNLAIENYADNDWYVSEKLWDSLLAWCLPIYYGGPAADKLLPPGSFLRLPSMDRKGLEFIQETIASPDAWHAAKDAIAEARQIVLHKLNLLNWMSDFTKKFS